MSDTVGVVAPLGFTEVVDRELISSANCVVLLQFGIVMDEVDVDYVSLDSLPREIVFERSCQWTIDRHDFDTGKDNFKQTIFFSIFLLCSKCNSS